MCIFSFFLTLFSSLCFWLRRESKIVSKLYYDEVTGISELNEIITVLIPRLWFLTALGNNKWIISFDTCFYFSFPLCSGLRTYFSLLQSKHHDILITLKMNVFHASKQLGTEQGASLFKWSICINVEQCILRFLSPFIPRTEWFSQPSSLINFPQVGKTFRIFTLVMW